MKKITITGAFGYSGKYTTQKLLKKGYKVQTITNSLNKKNPFGNKIEVSKLEFKNPEKFTEILQGTDVLINTYWVRFNHKKFTHNKAVENTKIMLDAAKKAGVKKIVHVSITNPDKNSDLEYFKGKAELEEYLKQTAIPFSIVRPAVLFGEQDILINNIAWMIRHMPIMGIFGKGEYKIQPIYVHDFAELLIKEAENEQNNIVNAIGAETFTYNELVKTIAKIIGSKKPIINVSPWLGYWVGKIISSIKKDVTITRPEIKGLMDNLLYVDDEPAGKTKLTDWAEKNKNTLGKTYSNELSRR
ncbi:MAG: NmrA family NAD(P)-binding protein [Bacteroidales bacterium]|nr:NmrA family NAD(P)-binding protein [Bacteroidales bacterium]